MEALKHVPVIRRRFVSALILVFRHYLGYRLNDEEFDSFMKSEEEEFKKIEEEKMKQNKSPDEKFPLFSNKIKTIVKEDLTINDQFQIPTQTQIWNTKEAAFHQNFYEMMEKYFEVNTESSGSPTCLDITTPENNSNRSLPIVTSFQFDEEKIKDLPEISENSDKDTIWVDGALFSLTISDYDLLSGQGWLNDKIIDSAIMTYQKEADENNRVFCANVFFGTYLKVLRLHECRCNMYCHPNNDPYSSVMIRNTFKEYDIFLFPWNWKNYHWTLIYVNIKNYEAAYFDSLGYFKIDYLKIVVGFLCALYNQDHDGDEKKPEQFKLCDVQLNRFFPGQNDDYNCGICVLMAIHTIMKHQGIHEFYHGKTADSYRRYLIQKFLKYNIAKPNPTKKKSDDQSTITDESRERNTQTVIKPVAYTWRGKDMNRMKKHQEEMSRSSKSNSGNESVTSSVNSEKSKKGSKKRRLNPNRIINVFNIEEFMTEHETRLRSSYTMSQREGKGPDAIAYYISPTNYNNRNDDEKKDVFRLAKSIIPDLVKNHLNFIKEGKIKVRGYETFLKRIKDPKKRKIWFKMHTYFSESIFKILTNEKDYLLRKYCQYSKLFVRGAEVFGSIWVNGKEALIETLDKKFIEDEKLTKYVENARKLGDNKYVHIINGSAINGYFFGNIEINDNWPRMTFVQGKQNNCLRRSLQSSLIYFTKRFEQNSYNRKMLMECINCIRPI